MYKHLTENSRHNSNVNKLRVRDSHFNEIIYFFPPCFLWLVVLEASVIFSS